MLGVLLSCDPVAYVRPVAHASYLFRAGGVNSDSIRVFNPAAEMLSLLLNLDRKIDGLFKNECIRVRHFG